jgi:hypothetical protein
MPLLNDAQWNYLTTQSWPARAAQGILDAAMAPGNAYLRGSNGQIANTQQLSDEAANFAVNLGLLGSAVPRPANSIGMGGKISSGNGAKVGKVLSESEFRKLYSQHIDLRSRGKNPSLTKERIMSEGFAPGFGPNTMPIYDPKATDIMSAALAPKKGDILYFPLNKELKNTRNGLAIKEGWKPQPYESVIVEYDNQNPYELYKKAIEAFMKTKNTP